MAQSVLIVAESGSGKSTSIRNLNSEETFIVNVASKPLPFKGWKSKYTLFGKENPNGNLINSSKSIEIIKCLHHISKSMPHIKTVVVDDLQYMSAFEYFEKAKEKGYDKFVSIATALANVSKLPSYLRDDLTVIFTIHSESIIDSEGARRVKAKTLGKMIDNSLTLEGLFTIVLFGKVKKTGKGVVYGFETQTDGYNTAKSPMEMFEDLFIPNDLQFVIDKIREYEN